LYTQNKIYQKKKATDFVSWGGEGRGEGREGEGEGRRERKAGRHTERNPHPFNGVKHSIDHVR
jgi:hypothetical protein